MMEKEQKQEIELNMVTQNKIRIAGIIEESIVDGPGIRFVIFFQGCNHGCKGCHNQSTHNLAGGYMIDEKEIISKIIENPLLRGVTFSGGEPLLQAEKVKSLIEKIKEQGSNLDLMLYTGFTLEELESKSLEEENIRYILENLDYIVDGPFIEEQRDLTLLFRGSKNQRFINLKEKGIL